MKIQKTMKDQGIKKPRTPVRVRKSARVKEGCQVSRIYNPKSLEDWHNMYKSQNLGEYLLTLLYSLQQEEEIQRRERETPVSKAW
jgi:hypothetical protein